jgi:hypothetical protein
VEYTLLLLLLLLYTIQLNLFCDVFVCI